MKKLFRYRSLIITLVAALMGGTMFLLHLSSRDNNESLITATVEEGVVRQVVSVSGSVRAENTAQLAFPTSGVVANVAVRKGNTVERGDILVTLNDDAPNADVLDAQAAVASARARRAELIAGATSETLAVQTETVRLKEEALARTKADETTKVENALRTLRSSDLTAYTTNANLEAPAPTISGTYLCDREGSYTLSVYGSNSASGYSFSLSGLESGTYVAATDQPIAFGTCGLRARFTAGELYHRTTWQIDIPNTKSSSYVTNKNAYELALSNKRTAVERAERELALAQAEASTVAAPARSEAIAQASAEVAQAEARLARTLATRRDTVLTAPFSGTVVDVAVVAGENVGTSPVITLLALDQLELTARVPEVDIGKLAVGQPAEVYFDTAPTIRYEAIIDFVSPQATVIDGVAYYEARLALNNVPPWIRSGLNADINIITDEAAGPRVPRRFVSGTDGNYFITTAQGEVIATTTVDVALVGNDGFVALRAVPVGTVVVAP